MTVSGNIYTAWDNPHLNVRFGKWYSGEEYRSFGEVGMRYESRNFESF